MGKDASAEREMKTSGERVLDAARAQGLRSGENPARWRGHLDMILPAPAKVRRVQHHAALPQRFQLGHAAQRLAIEVVDDEVREHRRQLEARQHTGLHVIGVVAPREIGDLWRK